MKCFDRHQMNIAKKTLKLSDSGARILGGLTKPEAILMLKQSGQTLHNITKLLLNNGHTLEECNQLLKSAMNLTR